MPDYDPQLEWRRVKRKFFTRLLLSHLHVVVGIILVPVIVPILTTGQFDWTQIGKFVSGFTPLLAIAYVAQFIFLSIPSARRINRLDAYKASPGLATNSIFLFTVSAFILVLLISAQLTALQAYAGFFGFMYALFLCQPATILLSRFLFSR